MVAVHEIPWEEASAPGFETTTRRVWREAVQEIADKAKQVLPECNGRVDSAVKIVLTGDVELLPDGKVRVASQSHGTTQYVVCNGVCECRDYRDSKAPSGWCKHRIASGLQKRATALLKQKLALTTNGHVETPPTAAPAPVPTPAEPDAPAPTPAEPPATPPGVPQQHVVTIQGKPFVKFAGLLQMAHEHGLVALTANWTYNDTELSLAHAVATFQDGRRFEESGDATPANVTKKVAPHFRRVALTRSKARVLRDALGVDLVAVEELAEE